MAITLSADRKNPPVVIGGPGAGQPPEVYYVPVDEADKAASTEQTKMIIGIIMGVLLVVVGLAAVFLLDTTSGKIVLKIPVIDVALEFDGVPIGLALVIVGLIFFLMARRSVKTA